jgi:hypothetical protein
MKPEDIREFARRPRGAVEEAKLDHWAAAQRSSAGLATLAAGYALFEHARRSAPGWPTEEQRAEDLAHHLQLKRLLDASCHAFTVRRPSR